MQQRIERRNRGAASSSWRSAIGVALGDVTCEDGDYFGMPVVEAARLCDGGGRADPHHGPRARSSAGARACLRAGRPARAAGIPGPCRRTDVRWEQPAGASAGCPLPPRLRGVPPSVCGPDGGARAAPAALGRRMRGGAQGAADRRASRGSARPASPPTPRSNSTARAPRCSTATATEEVGGALRGVDSGSVALRRARAGRCAGRPRRAPRRRADAPRTGAGAADAARAGARRRPTPRPSATCSSPRWSGCWSRRPRVAGGAACWTTSTGRTGRRSRSSITCSPRARGAATAGARHLPRHRPLPRPPAHRCAGRPAPRGGRGAADAPRARRARGPLDGWRRRRATSMDAIGRSSRARDHRGDRRQPVLRGRDPAPPLGVRRARAGRTDGRWELPKELEELGLPQSVREVVGRRVTGLVRTAAPC